MTMEEQDGKDLDATGAESAPIALDATGTGPDQAGPVPGVDATGAAPVAIEADEDDGFMSPAEAKLAEANER